MKVVTEIGPGELKKYIRSSKSASLMPHGCVLPARKGKVIFNFSDFESVRGCKLRLQRASGNGKIIVSVGGMEKPVLITARNLTYSVDLSDAREVEVYRPHDSIGDVFITSIVFDSEGAKESQVSNNWKYLISQCGKYTCLRLIKGKLYASVGGYIEKGEKIRHLETDPLNSFKNEGGKIVFKNNCEIRRLTLVNETRAPNTKQPFVDRKAAPKIEVGQNESIIPREKVPRPGNAPPRQAPTWVVDGSLAGIEDDVVFDSNIVSFNKIISSRSKIIKAIKSLGKDYLILKQTAHLTIPLSNIAPNHDYILILYGKALNGNGKVRVGISSTEHYYGDVREIIMPKGNNSKYVAVRSDKGKEGEMQRLHLMLPSEICTGELLISRIVLINNIDIHKATRKQYNIGSVVSGPRLLADDNFNLAIPNSINDQQYITVKKYARYKVQKMAPGADQFFKRKMALTTTSGMSWFNKIKIMFPQLEMDNDDPDICVGQPGFIKPAQKIWLDIGGNITQKDLDQLKKSGAVYSPSARVCQYLCAHLKGINIEVMRKPMPWVNPKEIGLFKKLDYVVFFNRNQTCTKALVEVWNNTLPKLVVVGARGSYPGYVIPTNEYLEYSQLIYIMMNAKCIIDLPDVIDYDSSLIGLAEALGTPTVTTNWSAMEKENALFLVKQDQKTGMPSKEALMNAVKEASTMTPKPLDRQKYNVSEMNRFVKMFA